MTHTLKCFPLGKTLILWNLDFFSGLLFMLSKAARTPFYFFTCNFVVTNVKFYSHYSKLLIIAEVTLSNQEKWRIISSQFLQVPNDKKELGMSMGKAQGRKYSLNENKRNTKRKPDKLHFEGTGACTFHCFLILSTHWELSWSQTLRKCSWIRLC